MKWYALRNDPKSFDFRRADLLLDFAAKNGLAMRGHTLLWNRTKWFPKWVADYDFGPKPAVEAERMLKDHIATVCGHCGDRVFAWDVVNETIDHDTGEMCDSVFTRYLGPQVIDVAFHAAREAAPHAQLVYNDYMSWGARQRETSRRRAAASRAAEEEQCAHRRARRAGPYRTRRHGRGHRLQRRGTGANGASFLDEATGMGLDLVITEFDVGDQTMPADIATRDAEVAALARGYLDLMVSYPQLRYVMAWGLTDKYSWLQGQEWWPRKDGLAKRPCPFDDDCRPKPLRDAIAEAFRNAPSRPAMKTA